MEKTAVVWLFVLECSVFLVDRSHDLDRNGAGLFGACVTLLGSADYWPRPNYSDGGRPERETKRPVENRVTVLVVARASPERDFCVFN